MIKYVFIFFVFSSSLLHGMEEYKNEVCHLCKNPADKLINLESPEGKADYLICEKCAGIEQEVAVEEEYAFIEKNLSQCPPVRCHCKHKLPCFGLDEHMCIACGLLSEHYGKIHNENKARPTIYTGVSSLCCNIFGIIRQSEDPLAIEEGLDRAVVGECCVCHLCLCLHDGTLVTEEFRNKSYAPGWLCLAAQKCLQEQEEAKVQLQGPPPP